MAADIEIMRIYASGKMIGMETNMSKKVFKVMADSMSSDIHRNSLVFDGNQIKAELLLELPRAQLLNWVFQCIAELHACLPALIKYQYCLLCRISSFINFPFCTVSSVILEE